MSFTPPSPGGDRSKLSFDEREILHSSVLPTAMRWLDIPGLKEHGLKTLSFWHETIPPQHRESRRD